MTIYFINNRPHVTAENHYKEISHYEYYMLLETETNLKIENQEVYD